MAGEALVTYGTYTQLIASEAETDGSFSTISASIDTILTDGTENYSLFDFKLDITSGTPTENGVVDLYRVPMDGTDQAPTPAGSYLPHHAGSFVLDNATDEYYIYGVPNIDENDKFIWQNNDGSVTLTCTLYVRGRTLILGV
jgi:hypothetical protein